MRVFARRLVSPLSVSDLCNVYKLSFSVSGSEQEYANIGTEATIRGHRLINGDITMDEFWTAYMALDDNNLPTNQLIRLNNA